MVRISWAHLQELPVQEVTVAPPARHLFKGHIGRLETLLLGKPNEVSLGTCTPLGVKPLFMRYLQAYRYISKYYVEVALPW